MFDKFKFDRWQIVYRKAGEKQYKLIPNPPYGWCADPFLVEYQGTVYLFAEIFLYKSERNGVIGYCIYENGEFGAWKITMDRHWHLSYPNVFVYQGDLYMCPESWQKDEIEIYKLIEFPDHWEKAAALVSNGKYVDTTFLQLRKEIYMFTFQPSFHQHGGTLLQCCIKGDELSDFCILTSDKGKARPAGNFIVENEKIIRVSQDSRESYGDGLVFSEVDSVWPDYREHEIKRVSAQDLRIENSSRKYIGIHTYNRHHDLEVVDVKYSCYSLKEYIARKRVRKVFMNKYKG